jgi:hypothetical protein
LALKKQGAKVNATALSAICPVFRTFSVFKKKSSESLTSKGSLVGKWVSQSIFGDVCSKEKEQKREGQHSNH